MLTIRELRAMRASMTLETFSAQLGPFVLIQKPPDAVEAQAAMALAARGTVLLPKKRPMDGVSLLFEFEDLEIATLPPLEAEAVLTIGRLPDNDVVLDHTSASKRHAEIRWTNGRCLVVDLGSTNGTRVNDAPVPVRAELKDSDIVAFGDVRFCFLLTPSLYRVMATPASVRSPSSERVPTAPRPPPPILEVTPPRHAPRPAAAVAPLPDPAPRTSPGIPLETVLERAPRTPVRPAPGALPPVDRTRSSSDRERTQVVPVLTPSDGTPRTGDGDGTTVRKRRPQPAPRLDEEPPTTPGAPKVVRRKK